MSVLLEIEALTKFYGAAGSVLPSVGVGVEVLKGVDLRLDAGDTVAIVGQSGSGKSTLLNIVGGLLPPSSGLVRFAGVDLAQLDTEQRAVLRNRSIGFIFQQHHLLPQCTALENVLLPTFALADPRARRSAPERARALLESVGLGERIEHRPAQLSGGECQRVAVVRALIQSPQLVLCDEPTGSLDAAGADLLGELLCRLNQQESVALLVVTHSAGLAARMARRYELRDGHLELVSAAESSDAG